MSFVCLKCQNYYNVGYESFQSQDLCALETLCDFTDDSTAMSNKLLVYYVKSVKLNG